MAERLAQTRANQEPRGEQPTDPAPDVKHCWYDGPHGRQAALLLKWRKATPGAVWEGYIAVASPDAAGWALVTLWVPASVLTPVGGPA